MLDVMHKVTYYNWAVTDLNLEPKYLILSHFLPSLIGGNFLVLSLHYSLNPL